ncbi:uncharacterized protein LOC124131410 isoform X2 [Haliotis rufescens]|nr:uncharacterized protein LOC124131410 isoform X2 [Haliotis rufescens]XP_046350656.1 uncharacterized protein LOC124131410 isoform X2 [Haliotis rufescens]XP_046350664.1 uncharacterized protein LOC124131410 isoform X2 [Haliotis rufescens]
MEEGVCGFCRRKDAEDICGMLHSEITDEGWVVAHHKCMQYSALLTQYKFSHFGGFKIAKVLDEYKRGKQTKCFVCGCGKKRKKVPRGATAGCAVRSCRRSFHYYCAKMSPDVVTKRLVVHIKTRGEKTVLYRVFCCKEHEDKYRKNLKHYLSTSSSNNNNSDVGSDDEGDCEDDEDYKEFDYDALSQNTNTTFVNISDTESPFKHPAGKVTLKHLPDESGDKSMFSSSNNGSDVSKGNCDDNYTGNGVHSDGSDTPKQKRKADNISVNSSPTKKAKASTSNRNLPELTIECVKIDSPEKKNNKKSQTSTGLSLGKSAESSKKKNGKKLVVKMNAFTSPGGKDKSETNSAVENHTMDHKGDRKVDHKGDRKASNEKSFTKPPPTSRGSTLDTCAVCIVGEAKLTLKLRQQLEKQVSRKLDVKTSNIFVWQDLDHTPCLPKQSMICFIQDLTERFVKQDIPEVTKLMFDNEYLEGKDKKLYQVEGGFLQRLNNQDIINQTHDLYWTRVTTQISKLGQKGGVFKPDGKRTLVLLLDDFIDEDGKMREKLGVMPGQGEPDMVTWTSATVVTKKTDEEDLEMGRLEVDTILQWTGEKFRNIGHVFVHPQEDILIPESEESDGVNDIVEHVQSSKSGTPGHTTIMVLKQIDETVVNFQAYCRKAFQKVLPSCLKTGAALAVLIDIRSLSSKSIHQQIGDVFVDEKGRNVPVTIRSVFDPSSIPVSFVVVEVDAQQLKVQKGNIVTPTKQTPKRSEYPTDLQKPSTSGVKRTPLRTPKAVADK